MKATITRIQDGKVYCKTVNPFGEKPNEPFSSKLSSPYYNELLSKWQQAESERVELELNEKYDIILGDKMQQSAFLKDGIIISIDQEIEATNEGNYFKII